MADLNEMPKGSYELENWLNKYLVGRFTDKMTEHLSFHLSRVLRGKRTSEFGHEVAEKIQALGREEFSTWVVDEYADRSL